MIELTKSIQLLKKSVLASSLCENLADGPCLNLNELSDTLPINEDLKFWFSTWYCNEDIFIPWTIENLILYSVINYPKNQEWYRWLLGTREIDQAWDENWLVIADISSDPIIIDTTDGGSAIKMAIHGCTSWEFKTVFPDLASFFMYCSEWLNWYFEIENRELRNDDCELTEESADKIRTIFLRNSKPEYWNDFKEFVGLGVI